MKKAALKTIVLAGVFYGVSKLLVQMKKDGKLDTKKMAATAGKLKDRVSKHAVKIGKLSKSAYDAIVDTTVGEVKGVSALSEGELSDLKDELYAGWNDVKHMLMSETKKKKKAKR